MLSEHLFLMRYLGARGKIDPQTLPRGPEGRALCRWCQCEVPARRRTFCSEKCVHDWKLRSQGDYLRKSVFQRDRGRCCGCGLDTQALARRLSNLGPRARGQWLQRLGLTQGQAFWEAHHVKGVFEGGGACGLDNIRTLCVRCHRGATANQRSRGTPKPRGDAET